MDSKHISSLVPQLLWKNFATICSIPHPSFHDEALANYIVQFGSDMKLETTTDEVGNILIRKPATKGFEDRKTVTLQAHIDMVPQKNNATNHDFAKDPIIPYIDGAWVTATDTTLGADNGIGAASIMAVLESNDIQHGPIEALFTRDEEVGMSGAFGLQAGFLKGDILLNTDTEDEDEIIIGCAGGMDANIVFEYTGEKTPDNFNAYSLSVSGLLGGHSGIDIHLNRANANVLVRHFLTIVSTKFGGLVSSIQGGNMRNAIPREATAVFLIPSRNVERFEQYFKRFKKTIKEEYSSIEPNIKLKLTPQNCPQYIMPELLSQRLITALRSCPNGVISMEETMENVVKTSNNISIIKTNENTVEINCLLRSSDDEQKAKLSKAMESLFTLFGARVELTGSYPGWQPSESSEILAVLTNEYSKVFGKSPKVKVVHAGLECGIIGNTYPQLDMVSFGPTIKHPHSPDEKVHIKSVASYWELLLKTLEAIPKK